MSYLFLFFIKLTCESLYQVYFFVLAISDTLMLFLEIPRYWILGVFSYHIRGYHTVLCKLNVYLSYVALDVSGWTLSCIAIERAIGVSVPHKYRAIVTKKKGEDNFVSHFAYFI